MNIYEADRLSSSLFDLAHLIENIVSFLSVQDLLEILIDYVSKFNLSEKDSDEIPEISIPPNRGFLFRLLNRGVDVSMFSIKLVATRISLARLLALTYAGYAMECVAAAGQEAVRVSCEAEKAARGSIIWLKAGVLELVNLAWKAVVFLWNLGPNRLIAVCHSLLSSPPPMVGYGLDLSSNNHYKHSFTFLAGLVGLDTSDHFKSSSMEFNHEMLLQDDLINDPILKRANMISRTATLLSYREKESLLVPRSFRSRVQRMMHYQVNLSPFEALVTAPDDRSRTVTEEDVFRSMRWSAEDEDEPFMCTPSSLPPTPHTRGQFIERSRKLTEDVVFLARAQLRLEQNQGSTQTQWNTQKSEPKPSKDPRRQLAVWDPRAKGEGIELTKGLHVATKKGNALYSTIRALASIPHNTAVYFEIQVQLSPLAFANPLQTGESIANSDFPSPLKTVTSSPEPMQPSLSIGVGTSSLPLNTLVGSWPSSVALSSSGQVLMGMRWYKCPGDFSYRSGDNVGVFLFLDGTVTVGCWDGEMLPMYIDFFVNGNIIPADAEYHREGPLLIPKEQEIIPTVTMHSAETEVVCHFCAEDIVHPPKNWAFGGFQSFPKWDGALYALDGSVIDHQLLP